MKALNIEAYSTFEVIKPEQRLLLTTGQPDHLTSLGWTEHHDKWIGKKCLVLAFNDRMALISSERELLSKPEFWTYTQDQAIKHNMIWIDKQCLIPGLHAWMNPDHIDILYTYDDGYGGRTFCTEVTYQQEHDAHQDIKYCGRVSKFIRRSENNSLDMHRYGIPTANMWPLKSPNNNPEQIIVDFAGVEALNKIAEIVNKPELT